MREIKFRVWDNCDNKMDNNVAVSRDLIIFDYNVDDEDDYNIEIDSYVSLNDNNRKYFNIMQYIGIKDTEGKDIYEGDIVEDCDGNRYEVYYDKYKFELKDFSNASFDYPTIAFSEGVFKVVGNIYQNKDLLEVK